MSAKRFLTRRIKKISGTNGQAVPDNLALEEPLEIQVAYGPASERQWKTAAIIGLTKPNGFNIYTGDERVRVGAGEPAILGVPA